MSSPEDEEVIETVVDHWVVPSWEKLDTRTIGPIIKAGGHDGKKLIYLFFFFFF